MARGGSSFRFRRSVGNKFFRVNLTKRGVGVSAGVPGMRRSWHSTGRRTTSVGIPGTGMSWVKTERMSKGRPPAAPQAGAVGPQPGCLGGRAATRVIPGPVPPDGWYPDPTGRFTERWWDRSGWTSRVRGPGGEQSDRL